MKKLLLCLTILGLLHSRDIGAQAGFSTLPLAKKETSAILTGQRIQSGPKYERALRIYTALVEARGDRRYPLPTLVMQNVEYQVACIDYSELEIILEEKAYDVCDAFGAQGDAALATLLGHELSHYYEKHAWRRNFVANYADLKVGIRLDSLHDDVANETQADYFGGFLTYSAGFGLFEKSAALIDSLYSAYGIPEQISGYPSLSDRKTLSHRTTKKLERLVEVFDMANLLTAAGKYGEACQYYKYILQEYQSREIYNNVGVTAILHALSIFDNRQKKFHLPIELDLETANSRGASNAEELQRNLLEEAIRHFDAAISMDPDYAPAYLNKACAYLLLGDAQRAEFYANVEARQAAARRNQPKVETDIGILLGILAANRGDKAIAQTYFETAAAQENVLARANLNLLLDKPEHLASFMSSKGAYAPESISQQTMTEIAQAPHVEDSRSVNIQKDLRFLQNDEQDSENGRLFVSYQADDFTYSLFLLTPPNYTGKTARGIYRGASYSGIEAVYGPPESRIQTPQGQLLVYKDIIFVLGPDDTLDRWVLFLLDQG
ncbi:MAG: tetratricopeptide repeat protein [Lewinellaceae bacterium]|nr:tetratricopeptide repeat protein [Saprospiraceae bacterium]MCB9331984.1 tetratricopeptide repeat protein [Lewinellaceae bacterium]